jgi:hypothetical protein
MILEADIFHCGFSNQMHDVPQVMKVTDLTSLMASLRTIFRAFFDDFLILSRDPRNLLNKISFTREDAV